MPSKPRLVARSTSPKSPWKYHKVPIVSSDGIPDDLKALFSCILWRVHEFENNPLKPDTFILLSDDKETISAAQKINIPVKDVSELRHLLMQKVSSEDRRATFGALEILFPKENEEQILTNGQDGQADKHADEGRDGFTFSIEEVLEQDEEVEALKKRLTSEKSLTSTRSQELQVDKAEMPTQPLDHSEKPKETNVYNQLNGFVKESLKVRFEHGDVTSIGNDTTSEQSDRAVKVSPSPPLEDRQDVLCKAGQPEPAKNEPSKNEPSPSKLSQEHDASVAAAEQSDSDDEEVVVFKPRSRRASGLPKPTPEPAKAKAAPSTITAPQPSPSQKVVKTQIESLLKPQSPVFVPRNVQIAPESPSLPKEEVVIRSQPPVVAQNGTKADIVAEMPPEDKVQDKIENIIQPGSPKQHQPQLQPVSHPQKKTLDLHTKHSEGIIQRQSRDIIQRQREAIQRHAQAAKPPPRKIQMQPTNTPTVIDPDAFDRSYVVQPRAHGPNVANGAPRGNHRGSPKRALRTPEPDVDFVLKSGSPRGATRGKGKLWVP